MTDYSSHETRTFNVDKRNVEDLKLLGKANDVWYMRFKRLMDIIIGIFGFGLLIFLYPIVAIITKLTSPGPVIYKQERVGLKGNIFTMYKFRTMINGAEMHTGPVWCKTNDDRVTSFGKILRKTKLDEIPQFINVLKGEMSFIGPRPERPFFVNKLKEQVPKYLMRLLVKPGITGWAQIHVNYDKNIDDVVNKVNHDLYYIENMSFLLDIKIILNTVKFILFGKSGH